MVRLIDSETGLEYEESLQAINSHRNAEILRFLAEGHTVKEAMRMTGLGARQIERIKQRAKGGGVGGKHGH